MTQTPTGQEAATATPRHGFAVFTQRFSSTPRGARLARHLAVHQLHTWGVPHTTRTSDTAALIVAELVANAVTHGRVPGRDFELRLTLTGLPHTAEASAFGGGTLRIEVADSRGERHHPKPGEVTAPPLLSESCRGLLLVDALASRWHVCERIAGPGKTVVAELDLPRSGSGAMTGHLAYPQTTPVQEEEAQS